MLSIDVIIWCYHFCYHFMLIFPPFFLFPENVTHSQNSDTCYCSTTWQEKSKQKNSHKRETFIGFDFEFWTLFKISYV